MSRKTRNVSKKMMAWLPLAALAALVFLGIAAFRAGGTPTVQVTSDLPAIGRRTTFSVAAREPGRGLSRVRVELVRDDRVETLDERSYVPREPWAFWGGRTVEDAFQVVVGSETVKGLTEGQAVVRVTADRAPAWLRRPAPVVQELTLPVKLRPPQLQVTSRQTYVAQGGCEAVVYQVSVDATRHGVSAGNRFFPGFPLPGGGASDRFALFAVPYDTGNTAGVTLLAADSVGNEARQPFIDQFFPKPFKEDTIGISDDFMSRVVPAILAQTPGLTDRGDLLQNYLMINGDLRRQNAETLNELSRASEPAFLWNRPFMQMRNAQVMSDFADRRSYVYNGKTVDKQDHLGFDLASTSRADIQAANDGKVVLARYFGIYGNTVIIDHGFGLMSLYGHLSDIAVSEGQAVERGATLGRSGATGLAGGDHLHFTMLLHGLPVNPREWWDGHWIEDRLELKLGAGMTFEP